MIDRPYYRIFRPNTKRGFKYVNDKRYSNDRINSVRAYNLISNDLKKIFEYIEPSDNNLAAFSLRNYELLLRACTEFESNAKKILSSNGYQLPPKPNMSHYKKIELSSKLSDYSFFINIWHKGPKEFNPFIEWKEDRGLVWYQHYNHVKHNRYDSFEEATLEDVINAVGALLIILFSQYGPESFGLYQDIDSWSVDDNGLTYTPDSLFSIKEINWMENELYDFDWNAIKTDPNPFQQFNFR